jgi:predicted dehydrogenase
VKIAVAGVGRMGRRHIQAARSLGLDVCAVCDTSQEALALAETEQGVAPDRHFDNLPWLLSVARPDCLIVATTAPTHADYTCMAAEAGVTAILCEKPMAVSLAECDRMRDVCRANGSKLAINHQMRFMEQYVVPKSIAEGEAFGGLSSVTVVGGNFGMSMNALHYFEMFRFMTDEAPCAVTAWFSDATVPNPRGAQFQDRAGAVRLETPRGRRFYLDCGADQGHGMQVIYAGPYGQLYVDELAGAFFSTVREAQHRALPTTRYGMPAVHTTQTIAPADVIAPSAAVLKALLQGENYPTGDDGRLAVAVLVAAYLSHERGHTTVDLDCDELPLERVFPWA